MRRIAVRLLLCLSLLPASAAAPQTGPETAAETGPETARWTGPAVDQGAAVCAANAPDLCLSLTCRSDGVPLLSLQNRDAYMTGAYALSVDGRAVLSATFDPVEGRAGTALPTERHAGAFDAIRRGGGLSLSWQGQTLGFTLRGSSNAVGTALRNCARVAAAAPAVTPSAQTDAAPPGPAPTGNERAGARLANEATVVFPNLHESEVRFERYSDLDLPGGDIRSGLDDPSLRGISEGACSMLCQLTEGCAYYTWNGRDGNVCFLKDRPRGQSTYQGAVSGVLSGTPFRLPGPPTPGPDTVVSSSAAWQVGEPVDRYLARLRGQAAPLGARCDLERQALGALMQGLEIDIPSTAARVGAALPVRWRGNALDMRVPVWVMVSSPDPVRFAGAGFFALGPEAPNPFGIAAGAGETRALVALWARGAGAEGAVSVVPLRAGPTRVTMRVVAWLRRCQEEVVLSETRVTQEAAPAPAEVVLNNEEGRAALTRAFDLPKWERRVLLNDERLLILSSIDGTEILQRQGRNLTLSPTNRFLAVESGDRVEAIDVLDGATVASLPGGRLFWSVGDSIITSSTGPWAMVSMGETFGRGTLFEDLATGPSCCMISGDLEAQGAGGETTTGYGLDIHNAALTVWGNFGARIVSAMNPDAGMIYDPPNAWLASSNTLGTPQLIAHAVGALGPVAPVALMRRPLFPGATYESNLAEDWPEDSWPRTPDVLRIAQANWLRRAGVEVTTFGPPDDTTAPNAGQRLSQAEAQLGRMGIRLVRGQPAEAFIRYSDAASLRYEETEDRRESLAPRLAQVRRDAEAVGYALRWRYDQSQGAAPECYHFAPDYDGADDASGSKQYAAGTYLPGDVDHLQRLETTDGPIYVGAASCVGGATGGSLRGQSAMLLLDLRQNLGGGVEDFVIERNGFLANTRAPKFFEAPFEAKLVGDLLLTYAPGAGAISLYDLERRAFLWIGEDLPGGDLMVNAALTEDLGHIVQVNSDGSLALHRIADSDTVLAGRIVDDEIALWTEDWRFDATAEAAARVDLRFPGLDGQFSFDRFDTALRDPLLVRTILTGGRPDAVAVSVPPDLTGTLTGASGEISGAFSLNPDRGAVELRLFQDGVQTDTVPLAPRAAEASVRVPRLPGARWATVVAADADGLVSLPVTADLGAPDRVARRDLMVVGVDIYDDPELGDLNFAKADADRIRRAARSAGFEMRQGLVDRSATPDAIADALAALVDGLTAEDHAVVFFAGHALQGPDARLYLGTTETDLKDLPGTALPWDRLSDILQTTEARVTILLDACHAGAAGTAAFATNDDAARGLTQVPGNVTIMAASKGRQTSKESGAVGGGFFSIAFEQVVTEDRARFDTNGNGAIEASELDRGLRRTVSEMSGGEQTPWMTKSRLVGDYALF